MASKWPLTLASAAALIASSCCILPLALVALGISGAWMGTLRLAQPYSTSLALLSAALLGFYWKRLLRPNRGFEPDGQTCRRISHFSRLMFWFTAALTALILNTKGVTRA